MTPQKIAALVKRVISRKTDADIGDIKYAHSLSDEYDFDDRGKQNLAPSLNAEFANPASRFPRSCSPGKRRPAQLLAI